MRSTGGLSRALTQTPPAPAVTRLAPCEALRAALTLEKSINKSPRMKALNYKRYTFGSLMLAQPKCMRGHACSFGRQHVSRLDVPMYSAGCVQLLELLGNVRQSLQTGMMFGLETEKVGS